MVTFSPDYDLRLLAAAEKKVDAVVACSADTLPEEARCKFSVTSQINQLSSCMLRSFYIYGVIPTYGPKKISNFVDVLNEKNAIFWALSPIWGGRGDLFLKFFKRREKSKTLGEVKYFRGGEGKKGKYLVSEGEEKVGKYLVSKGEEEQRMKRRKISYRRQDCCGTDVWTDIDGKCCPKAILQKILI